MATNLTRLKLSELSLVDDPANKHARVTIFKRRKEGDDVSETITKKEHDEAIAALAKKSAEALAQATRLLEQVSKLSKEERDYMDDMSDDEKKAFLAMSDEERKKKVSIKKSDESLVVNGVTIMKSKVGDGIFEVMKSQQAEITANKAAIAKAQDDAQMALLTKRASEEFGHLPGKPEEIAKVLKHAASMPEAERKTFEAALKAQDASQAGAFERSGHGGGPIITGISKAQAKQTFMTKVAEIRKRDTCSHQDAMRKAQVEAPEAFVAFQAA